jgi:CRISPR-associated endonuclease/helicase Cas3
LTAADLALQPARTESEVFRRKRSPIAGLLLLKGQGIAMPQFFAHSGVNADKSDWQPLASHLTAVAALARERAKAARPTDHVLADSAHVAGLLHDLGKYRLEWQAYLSDCGPQTPHAIHGAAYAAFRLDNLAIAFAVAGHHAGLHDCAGLFGLAQNLSDKSQFTEILQQITLAAQSQIDDFPITELAHPFEGNDDASQLRREFWTRVLFSVLVDADRLETEQFYTGSRSAGKQLDGYGLAGRLLVKLNAARKQRTDKALQGKTDVVLLDLRNRIYDAAVAAGTQDQGFFELTVPTGGGKTLSGMAFALAHAAKHNLRRVIVVIPYLSIIEQNAREYRTVFGPQTVLEHHSAIGEPAGPSTDSEMTSRSSADLATDNWDAPIIVTTSVQFLETLLESSARRCRKLHNVARSVVLFDEAQALPTHLLNPLVSVFRELHATFGCSVVFSTATQPAFRQGSGLTQGLKPGELKPLLHRDLVTEAFSSLQRVNYRLELDAPWDWDALCDRLVESQQTLCVLNTRRQAREVWETLRARLENKEAVIHLSSALCAEHRLNVLGRPQESCLGTIRARLKAGLPCWLISTQAIEAGVDVDFPRVFRALGPLDSVVQAAGRCNREGALKNDAGQSIRGEVIVFQPADEGIPPGLYKTATGKARTFLMENTSEQVATDPYLFARYFAELYGIADCDVHAIQTKRAAMQYREVAALAKVIADSGTPVVVPYNDGKKWIRRIERMRTINRPLLRRLQRYTVNVRTYDLKKLEALGAVRSLLGPDGPLVLDESAYDQHLGVVIRGLSLGDFIQ